MISEEKQNEAYRQAIDDDSELNQPTPPDVINKLSRWPIVVGWHKDRLDQFTPSGIKKP